MKVRSAVLAAPEHIEIREFERPSIGEYEGLLRVELAGLCGTDVKLFKGELPQFNFPFVLGHEILGYVEAIGPRAAEIWGVRPGDRVVVEGQTYCGRCRACLAGRQKFCERSVVYGMSVTADTPPYLWGACGEYLYLAPGAVLYPVSQEVPAEAAVLAASVIANGIYWARMLGGVTIGDVVVVQGLGPQGLAAMLAAREAGARAVVGVGLSRDISRFELAQRLGATHLVNADKTDPIVVVRDLTASQMADVVVDATGSSAAVARCLELVRPQGTVVCGGLTGTATLTPLEVDRLVWKEVSLRGAYRKNVKAIQAAISLIESRRYPLEQMVTHVYPLVEVGHAIRVAAGEVPGEQPVKVAIRPA